MSNSFDFLLPSLNETYSDEAIVSFRIKMHVNAFLTIVFDSLAVYLILFTSDRAIGTYRWFLLNIVVSSFAYDVFVTAGFMPLPLVPVAGVCTLGMLRMKGDVLFGVFVPMMCVVQLLACCGMSALLAVIYRLAAVYNVQKRLFNRRSLFVLVVVQVLWGAPTNAVAYMALLDAVRNQDVIAANAVQELPYLKNVVENELCGFSTMSESFWLRTTVWIGGIQIAIVVVLAIGCWTLSIGALYKERSKMSAKRFYLQRQLIFALALQLAIPVLTLLVPFSLSTISLLWKVHVEGIQQSAMQLATSHSVWNTALMIFLTKRYRQAFFELLDVSKWFPKSLRTSRTSSRSSSKVAAPPLSPIVHGLTR